MWHHWRRSIVYVSQSDLFLESHLSRDHLLVFSSCHIIVRSWEGMTNFDHAIMFHPNTLTLQYKWISAFKTATRNFIFVFRSTIRQFFPIFDIPFPPCWQFFSTIPWQFWPIFDPSPLSIVNVIYGRPLIFLLNNLDLQFNQRSISQTEKRALLFLDENQQFWT